MRRRAFSRVATMTRATVAESSTPATNGPFVATARASRELAAVTSPVQTLAHRFPCRFEHLREARGIFSAARRALRAATALAIDDGREHLFHERIGVHLRREVLGDVHDERGGSVAPRSQHHDARADRLADPIRQRAELIDVPVPDIGRDELGVPNKLRLCQQRGGHAVDAAALQRRELLLQAFARLDELSHALGHARGRYAKRSRRTPQPLARLADLPQRTDAGHRFDAPHAGADALLLRDEERPDVTGAV